MRLFIRISFFCFIFGLLACKSPYKQYRKSIKHTPFDAVIVPGAPYKQGDWFNPVLRDRIKWAVHLYKTGHTKNIIFSGAAVYTPFVESKIMKQIAIHNGVPDSVIYCDTLAEHSVENVYYSSLLAEDVGFRKIALATDPFQSSMIKGAVRRIKRNFMWERHVEVLPIQYDSLQNIPFEWYVPKPLSAMCDTCLH